MQRNNRTRVYLDTLKCLGLTNLIQETTHIKQQNLGFSMLDHFFKTDPGLYNTNGTIITNASDHFMIFTTRKKLKEEHGTDKVKGRAYSKINKDNLISDLNNNDWDRVFSCEDSETVWGEFKHAFLKILHHAPLKVFGMRDDKTTVDLHGIS